MGLFEKIKTFFTDEYEEDEEIKKEVIQVKIPTPERKKSGAEVHEYEPNYKYDPDYERTKSEDHVEEECQKKAEKTQTKKLEDTPAKPIIPTYFDDDDFKVASQRKEPEIVKQEYKYTRTETVIKPTISSSAYGIKKEEIKKNFKPTPIISPIYGVLDKNYKKEEISPKKKISTIYSQFDKVDVDDIRNKAYGTLEDELEKNLSRDAIIFNDEIDIKIDDDKEITEYEEQPLDIFKELEKKDALDDLLDSYQNVNDKNEESSDEKDRLVEDALNKDYDNYEEELNASYKEDINDSDLFNLIDTMYNNKEESE